MKKLCALIVMCIIACAQPKNEMENLAFNIVESLQDHDLEKFKDHSVEIEFLEKNKNSFFQEDLTGYVSDLYLEAQEDINNLGVNLKDYEIYEVREPFKREEIDGKEAISFFAILKNSNGEYLKLKFRDCLKTESGYLMTDDLKITDKM